MKTKITKTYQLTTKTKQPSTVPFHLFRLINFAIAYAGQLANLILARNVLHARWSGGDMLTACPAQLLAMSAV
jgi:hypothetical protein